MTARKRILIGVGVLVAFVAVGFLARYAWNRYEYPYGRTHRCSRAILLGLIQYAGDHNDKFPHGGATPEASLSILYKEGYVYADFLAGRAKTEKEVKAARKILESGGVLGPDTCDWHYEDRVNHDADAFMAVFWGKSDLGHVGQRLHGGHEVALNCGSVEVIPADKWQEFLAEHERMVQEYLKGRPAPADNAPR